MVNKDDLIGQDGEKFYQNEHINIVGSSIRGEPYTARWYRRQPVPEDPWVSLRNHNDPAGEIMLYGQGSYEGHVDTLKNNGSANVFIRKFEL